MKREDHEEGGDHSSSFFSPIISHDLGHIIDESLLIILTFTLWYLI